MGSTIIYYRFYSITHKNYNNYSFDFYSCEYKLVNGLGV